MNIIKLCGGLGNQIFQYAFGKAQMLNGISVWYDNSWFSSQKNISRQYILNKFCINVTIRNNRKDKKIIHEKGFDLSLLQKDGFYFSGYWQYPAYYDGILPILREEFCVRKELYTKEFLDLRQEIIMNNNSVAVHVRRGDYTYLDGFPVMPIEYYQKALENVKGEVYVFSDDMEWCRDKFDGARHIHLNEYFDFELMKLCKHQILSRSSYGWWAARLNTNPNKTVIVPKQQLECAVRKQAEKYEHGLYDPIEWIQC